MTYEILATIITGGGVILTILVSSFFNWKRVNVELNQLKQQNQLTYATQLLEKRHEHYPRLYNVIIAYINGIRAKDIKNENLIALHKKLTAWDQDYSILLSAKSQFSLFRLLKSIRTVVNSKNKTPTRTERKEIMESIRRMELALKSDLGVFMVEFSGAPEDFFDNYTSLFEEAQKDAAQEEGGENNGGKEKEEEVDTIGERPEGSLEE